jgi:hypothetical protein
VDANSHTNFSLPPARTLLYFISPPSFLPKIQKANPCLLCRLTYPTISQTLTPPFFLSPSIYLRLSFCRLLFLSLQRNRPCSNEQASALPLPLTVSLTSAEQASAAYCPRPLAKKNRPCSPSVARKTFGNFFFPPPPTTSRPGTPSSSRSTRPPGLPSSL